MASLHKRIYKKRMNGDKGSTPSHIAAPHCNPIMQTTMPSLIPIRQFSFFPASPPDPPSSPIPEVCSLLSSQMHPKLSHSSSLGLCSASQPKNRSRAESWSGGWAASLSQPPGHQPKWPNLRNGGGTTPGGQCELSKACVQMQYFMMYYRQELALNAYFIYWAHKFLGQNGVGSRQPGPQVC